MNYRNAKYNKYGTIDCEFLHPHYGWIPFTAGPEDSSEIGRALFDVIDSDGTAEAYIAEEPQVTEEIIQQSLFRIDNIATSARSRFITTGAGQEMIYLEKESQARSFIAAGYPEANIANYKYIAAEASVLEVSGRAVADTIVAQADLWEDIGVALESARIKAKRLAELQVTVDAIEAVIANFEEEVSNIN